MKKSVWFIWIIVNILAVFFVVSCALSSKGFNVKDYGDAAETWYISQVQDEVEAEDDQGREINLTIAEDGKLLEKEVDEAEEKDDERQDKWRQLLQEMGAAEKTGKRILNYPYIAITGRGTLDGQGNPWWEALRRDKNRKEGEEIILTYGRPRVINLYRCRNVLIQGVTIVNSPSWTVHPVGCEDLVVEDISIINPEHSPNTDGVNPESCRNVRISNCFIDTGDDCITLKSGRDEEGRLKGRPTENVTITNCVMYKGHGAVVIGSEMSGGVRNVTASNIVCVGTDRAVRIKSTRGRGGVVENIRFCNFVVENVREPIYITSFYTKTDPEPVSERTPVFRDIAISHFTIKNSPCTAKIFGLPEMPVKGLRISDVVASTQGS